MKKLFSLLVLFSMLSVLTANGALKKSPVEKSKLIGFEKKTGPLTLNGDEVRWGDALSRYFMNSVIALTTYTVGLGNQDFMISQSENGLYSLWIQGDGNLVLYKNEGSRPGLWSSNTDGSSMRQVTFTTNGRILLDRLNGTGYNQIIVAYDTVWPFHWILQDDGNLVRYWTELGTQLKSISTGTANGKKSKWNHQFH